MRKRLGVVLGLGLSAALAGCALWEQAPVVPPRGAPAELKASTGTETRRDEIVLTWNPVDGATYYEVQRAEERDGHFERVGTSPTNSFRDSVEKESQWYWYRVRACNAAGCGPWSDQARGYAGPPPRPENVQASDGAYPDRIVITWDPMPGALYYQIFRDPSPQPNCKGLCILADDLPSNSYTDENVRVGIRYQYAVRACNRHGCSELSHADSGCRQPCPPLLSTEEE